MSGLGELRGNTEFRSRFRFQWIRFQWIGMILLALFELLIVSTRFDSKVLVEGQGLLSLLAARLPLVPQIVAVVGAATLVFGGKELADCLSRVTRLGRRNYAAMLLIAHLFTFTLFLASSAYFFEIDRGASASSFAIWAVLAFATAVTWLAVLVDHFIWLAVAKELFGPIMIGSCVGGLAWFTGQWAIELWGALAFATFQLVRLILTLFCVDVFQDSSNLTIGSSEFSVTIAPECSGYEGMGLAVVFITTYLWWKRKEHLFPRSFLLIPAAIGLMFIANTIRIATLILIGHFGAQGIALGGFHSQAGWIGFNLVAVGLIAFARTSPLFCETQLKGKDVDIGNHSENRSVPMLAPFVFLTLTIMLLGAVQTGFDWLYPVRFFVVAAIVTICFKQYPKEFWDGAFHWTAFAIGLAVYLVWNLLETKDAGIAEPLYATAQELSPVMFIFWLVFRVLGSVITVPIAEELAFRGYLLPWLAGEQSNRWSWVALLVSSIAFGVLHPGRWIAGTIAGILYGIAYYRRRKLMDAILAHSTTNAFIAVETVLLSRWYLWG